MGVGYEVACQLADAMGDRRLQSEQAYITAINSLIYSVRHRLNMEVGFVSEFTGGRRYFRYLDATEGATNIEVGDSDALEDSLCQRVIAGDVPALVTSAVKHEVAQQLPIVRNLPVGAHLSVPVELSDGTLFGTFCVFSRYDIPGLNHRSLTMMKVFADVIASLIEDSQTAYLASARRREEITGVLERNELTVYAQPIYNLSSMAIVGYELLARQTNNPDFSPEVFFDDAEQLGLTSMVGLRLLEQAQQALVSLPSESYIAINVTPAFIMDFDFLDWFTPEDSRRIVLELTEHHKISDYIAMKRRLQPLKDAGMRLAIDDAGAGYASMRHILQLRPDVIKLDMSLIRDIHLQPEHQSLLAALQVFARTQGYSVVAEGIEVAEELSFLRTAAVCCGQGFHLMRPQPLGYFTG